MGYQSKTYSLSDEVIDAIESAKAGGTSPNKFLRELMGLDGESEPRVSSPVVANSAQIAGVERGVVAQGAVEFPFHPKCDHCGENFGAYNRSLRTCSGCKAANHSGDPRNCDECVLRQGGA